MLEDKNKVELIAIIRKLERNNTSLASRVDELEIANKVMLEQVQTISKQGEQWHDDRTLQNNVIQRHLSLKNAEIQALNERVAGLKAQVRELTEKDD